MTTPRSRTTRSSRTRSRPRTAMSSAARTSTTCTSAPSPSRSRSCTASNPSRSVCRSSSQTGTPTRRSTVSRRKFPTAKWGREAETARRRRLRPCGRLQVGNPAGELAGPSHGYSPGTSDSFARASLLCFQQVRELNNTSSTLNRAAHLARDRAGTPAHPPKPVAARCPPRAPQEAECVAESPSLSAMPCSLYKPRDGPLMAISDDCTVPHDQESLKQTLDSILAELDSLVKSAQSIVREEFLYV